MIYLPEKLFDKCWKKMTDLSAIIFGGQTPPNVYHNVPENVIVIDSYELQNELILEKLHRQTYSGKIVRM